MSVVQKIDSAISYIPRERKEDGRERPRRRIIYFCSGDRHIIKKAINESSYLWELLMPENQKIRKELRYEYLEGYQLLELLSEEVNMKLWMDQKIQPYSREVYTETVIACACDPNFRPYGETNMGDIVRIWYQAKKNEYRNASKENFFPFDKIIQGKALPKLNMERDYDQEMYKKIGKAIVQK